MSSAVARAAKALCTSWKTEDNRRLSANFVNRRMPIRNAKLANKRVCRSKVRARTSWLQVGASDTLEATTITVKATIVV